MSIEKTVPGDRRVRQPIDTVGFAHRADQLGAILDRTSSLQGVELAAAEARLGRAAAQTVGCRVAICPHDDYSYVGYLYPALLRSISARVVILFGGAHKARLSGVEDLVVFDTHTHWHGPYREIEVDPLREELIKGLGSARCMISDDMHRGEHSIEAIIPFLQHFRPDVAIVPVLVPSMRFEEAERSGAKMAAALDRAMTLRNLAWGTDVTLVISSDAVHYGDEGWGGKDFAEFGTDADGYTKAVRKELRIVDVCLTGGLDRDRIRRFVEYTVDPLDHREYRWTWCGRYSVPYGLAVALELQRLRGEPELCGNLVGYATSIDGRAHIPVEDLGMGVTADAHLRHWVGYAAVRY